MSKDIQFHIGSVNNKAQTQPYTMGDNEQFTVYAVTSDNSPVTWSVGTLDNFTSSQGPQYKVISPNSVQITAPMQSNIGSNYRGNAYLMATSGNVSRLLRLVTI